MYSLRISPEMDSIFSKLVKKNRKQYEVIMKKVQEIIENPQHYKNLRGPLQLFKRVHIDKHFFLLYSVDEDNKTITLEYFDHHDNVYNWRP